MIRLTEVCYDHLGNPYEKSIVVPDNIVIKDEPSNRIGGGNCKIVVLGVGKYEVKETFEEVARKVLEWRLAMERYRAALIAGKHEIAIAEYRHIKQLNGLEGPKDDT